jgi:hypothetical protein
MTIVAHAHPQLMAQLVQTTLQQQKPKPPKRPYASFLEDFVGLIHPGLRPASIHTLVSEWLESVGSDREKQCRSDSYLHHSEDAPVLRNITRSAPDVGYPEDADKFAVPPTLVLQRCGIVDLGQRITTVVCLLTAYLVLLVLLLVFDIECTTRTTCLSTTFMFNHLLPRCQTSYSATWRQYAPSPLGCHPMN